MGRLFYDRQRFPNRLRMQPCHGEQVLRRAAGFAGAAFPFADGGEGDAEHGGKVFLSVIEIGEDSQTIVIRILEALTLHGRSVFTKGMGVFRRFA